MSAIAPAPLFTVRLLLTVVAFPFALREIMPLPDALSERAATEPPMAPFTVIVISLELAAVSCPPTPMYPAEMLSLASLLTLAECTMPLVPFAPLAPTRFTVPPLMTQESPVALPVTMRFAGVEVVSCFTVSVSV